MLAQLLTSLAVAAPAGFNAYLALLLVGLGSRFGWVQLVPPYDVLGNGWALGVLLVLLTIEVVADKIPALDSLNDVIGTVVRPASGAVLFAGTNPQLTEANALVSLLVGGTAAGAFHAVKAGSRPIWTASTGGLANPVVSVFEDLFVGATVILAMLAPVVAIVVILVTLAMLAAALLKLRGMVRRHARRFR